MPTPRTISTFGSHALVLAGFAAVMVAMTWPLAPNASDHLLGAAYYWDAFTNTMLMGSRVRNALGSGPGGVYDNYFFAPIPDSIAFNENLFGLSLLFAPFYLVTRSPLLAYNLTLLSSLALSGYFTFLLVRRLSGSTGAGLVAGVGFALGPYAFFEIGRIQLVATQFIPLFFLFLHRAAEEKRPRDLFGLGFAYAMQVGTCLYYAMFMLPLAALLGALLLRKHRPFPARLAWPALASALATAAAALFMVFAYFSTRKRFGLIRSEDFAQNFDGKLSFFLHVHPTNRLLTFMHHVPLSEDGAHEEIAFPGFTLALLALVALVALVFGARGGVARSLRGLLYLACAGAAAGALTLLGHSFFLGAVVVLIAALLHRRVLPATSASGVPGGDWLWLLLLSIVLFLGFEPLTFHGAPVRGLYSYLHAYVPGFDGIRKVSRQAVLTSLCFAVLAGFGAAALLQRIGRPALRHALVALLLCGELVESRNAPFPLVEVPAGERVSAAYRFIAAQKGRGAVAVVPTSFGLRELAGARGLALHNYLALFHGRRMLNGKSSWIPPVTHLFQRGARQLPSEAALRILRILRPQFLVVHGQELGGPFARKLVAELEHRKNEFRRVFRAGADSVYELLPSDDKTLGLLETPALDERGLVAVQGEQLGFSASVIAPEFPPALAVDGDPSTRWASGRFQMPGDFVELTLPEPRAVVAVDFSDYALTFDNPGAFRLEASEDGVSYHTVLERPQLRLYYAQVYAPKGFLFRVKLASPARARKLRLTLLDAMPSRWLSVYEARVWVQR